MPVRTHKASDYIKTPEDAAAYLNAAIEEMGDDPRLLMKAFRNVAEARGGVSRACTPGQAGSRGPLPSPFRATKSSSRYACESLCRLRHKASFLGVTQNGITMARGSGANTARRATQFPETWSGYLKITRYPYPLSIGDCG